MKRYLIQQGINEACIYWNGELNSSHIWEKLYSLSDDFKNNGFEDKADAYKIRDYWDYKLANNKSVFKVIEIEL